MIVAFIVFPVIFLIVLLCVGFGMAFFETQRKNQVRKMLWTADPVAAGRVAELVRSADTKDAAAQWFSDLKVIRQLDTHLDQSMVGWNVSRFLFTSLIAGLAAGAGGWKLGFFGSPPVSALILLLVGMYIPWIYVSSKRAKSMKAFEEQFPEALDFLSRSMRAGHGFSISMEILAKDNAEPLAGAFQRVCHEMQLGSPLNLALEKLLIQFPLVDVRFFVSAILLQQETGGNLSEILNRLAGVVRERFRLRGQVKALSAHGRVTGGVLLFMPIVVVLILLATNPAYLKPLSEDKIGRWMLYGVCAGQVVGYLVIKKIVNIKV